MQNEWLKRYTNNIFLVLAALIFFTGTVSGQTIDSQDPELKVIQLSPDAGPANVLVDGEQIGSGLGFGELAATKLDPGSHQITITSDNIDISRTVNLSQNQYYTLTVNNRVVNPGTTLLSQNTTVSEGQTKLRLAHFSPDLLGVDATTDGSSSFSATGLNYRETTDYVEISPGNYTIEVTEPRIGGASFNQQISLEANKTYTGFVSGLKAGPSDQRLRIIPVAGRIETEVEEDQEQPETEPEPEEDDGVIRKDLSLVCRFEEIESD